MSAQITAACKPDPRTHRWHSQGCGYLSGHGDERDLAPLTSGASLECQARAGSECISQF